MKIFGRVIARTLLASLLIVCMISCNLSNEKSKKDKLPEHPRMLFQAEDEAGLKKYLSGDNYVAELSKIIIESADTIIDAEPVVYKKQGKRLLFVSRTCLQRVMYLSYSYRITNEVRYAERAEKEMLAAAAFENWNPSHFLDVAEMTAALGIGYDWLFNELSEESKTIIRTAIVEKGLIPSKDDNYNDWLERGTNWNQVCNGGLSLGAMAIYESEPELSQEIIDRAVNSMKLPLLVYEPDGAYPEGNSYWEFGTMYQTLFIDAYRKTFGDNENLLVGEGFMNSGYYFLHSFGPLGSYNYSDAEREIKYAPAIFWFASELYDNSMLFHQNKILKELANPEIPMPDDRYLPMIPIWASRLENLEINDPAENSWTGKGENPISVHRTSWDNDGIFIGIKGGTPKLQHTHLDIGSFVMDAMGVRWSMDFGRHNYYSLETHGIILWDKSQGSQRWEIFRYNNFSHSTLTINNKHQSVDAHSKIIKSSDREQFKSAVVDISSAYQGSLSDAKRGIAIVDNKYIILRDEIVNDTASAIVRWAMLTHDDITILSENQAIIKKDGKELKFLLLEPENAKIQTYSTEPEYDFEEKNPNTVMIGFEINLMAKESQTLRVALIPLDNKVPEKINSVKLEDW